MENIDDFNLGCAMILARMYEAFPVAVTLDVRPLAAGAALLAAPAAARAHRLAAEKACARGRGAFRQTAGQQPGELVFVFRLGEIGLIGHGSPRPSGGGRRWRRELLEADARAMSATLTRDLIAPIVRLNLGEDAPLPSLKLLSEGPEDLSMLADHVVKLTQAGLPIPQWWVREKFGIPEVAESEAVLLQGAGIRDQESGSAHAVSALHATSPGDPAIHARQDQDLAARVPDLLADRMEIETEAAWGR